MLKRFTLTLLAILLFCTVFAATALADSRWQPKPTTEELQAEALYWGEELIGGTAEVIHSGNYRLKATQYSDKVGMAVVGEIYEILDYHLTSNDRSWLLIDWNGREVWVSASLVRCSVSNALDSRMVSPESLIGTTIRIHSACGRVRKGAGTEFSVVGYVYQNEEYQVLDAYASDTKKIWYQVRADGRLGWISSGITENLDYLAGGTDAVTSASSRLDVDAVTSSSVTSGGSQEYPAGERCRVIAESARARSGAGTVHSVVAYVYRGERYDILAVDTASNGKQWYQIRVDGKTCWVSSGVTELD